MSQDDTKPDTAAAVAVDSENSVRTAIEIAVRLGVLLLLVAWCLQIVAPFIGILVWALVIAIGSTTPYEKLVSLFGERRGLAAAAVVLVGLLILIVPAVMLSETLVSGAQYFAEDVAKGRIAVPPPPPKVADWPIVGEQIFEGWQLASLNLEDALAASQHSGCSRGVRRPGAQRRAFVVSGRPGGGYAILFAFVSGPRPAGPPPHPRPSLRPDDGRLARGRRSRARIREAARCLFREAGFDGATLRAIAGRAGMGTSSIYRARLSI